MLGYGLGGGREVDSPAPFVLKTYRMVNDPATNSLIVWGRENNSFVVVDPFVFSQTLLPAHFKHNNFSSFVRQLNTYGFKKVDPDRWEFAHASFLRGQMHLLKRVVRRTGCGGAKRKESPDEADLGDEESAAVAMELVRLRREHKEIKERTEQMWSRVQETERRPKQMLALLLKVVSNPELLQRLVGTGTSGRSGSVGEKRPRDLLEGTREYWPSWNGDGTQGNVLVNQNHNQLQQSSHRAAGGDHLFFVPAAADDIAELPAGQSLGGGMAMDVQVADDWASYLNPY